MSLANTTLPKPMEALFNFKFDASRVVNSLSTTASGYALDARAGKSLQDQITALKTAGSAYLPLTGGTVTGDLTVLRNVRFGAGTGGTDTHDAIFYGTTTFQKSVVFNQHVSINDFLTVLGSLTVGSSLRCTGKAVFAETLYTEAGVTSRLQGDVYIGRVNTNGQSAGKLTVYGTINPLNSIKSRNIYPTSDLQFSLGKSDARYLNIFGQTVKADKIQAKEIYAVDASGNVSPTPIDVSDLTGGGAGGGGVAFDSVPVSMYSWRTISPSEHVCTLSVKGMDPSLVTILYLDSDTANLRKEFNRITKIESYTDRLVLTADVQPLESFQVLPIASQLSGKSKLSSNSVAGVDWTVTSGSSARIYYGKTVSNFSRVSYEFKFGNFSASSPYFCTVYGLDDVSGVASKETWDSEYAGEAVSFNKDSIYVGIGQGVYVQAKFYSSYVELEMNVSYYDDDDGDGNRSIAFPDNVRIEFVLTFQ